jgi:branched-subunit amino acid ABC-type transport system permease component
MNRILNILAIIIFSIFIGSQITEGFLLVPYWKSLSSTDFYKYYAEFGPSINRFFSILTIISVLIPISYCIYYYLRKSPALKYAIASSFFALLIIALFLIYFKDVNQQFYNLSFTNDQLSAVLNTWGILHWLRVLIEFLSLGFLLIAINNYTQITDK